jgi:molybdate transport system substrate-binding protein
MAIANSACRLAWLAAVVVLISGCATTSGSSPALINVYGAASLKGVLAEARSAFEASHPGTTLTISTDSSAAIETQIEQGAPADVFLSADTSNPQKLVDKGVAAGPPVAFAGNLLTIIVPADNPASVRSPADLARPGVRIIAAGTEVPITKYASQLVTNLVGEQGYPTDFVARYAANVVSREDNVMAIVAKLELGEADAGIVYVTDAKASTKVTTVPVPAAANVPARYAGVVVSGSAQAAAATIFLTWFAGPDGQQILARSGFLPPS